MESGSASGSTTSGSTSDVYEARIYVSNKSEVSFPDIETQINNDNPLNDHLRKLYVEQKRKQDSQERRRKWVEKWGMVCCCLT